MKNDRKELIRAYKEQIPPKAVFCIRNLINGKVFLASTMNFKGSFDSHRIRLENNMHFITKLQNDWNELGKENFEFEVLEEVKIKEGENINYDEELLILEAIWIEKFQPLSENTYNKNEKIRIV